MDELRYTRGALAAAVLIAAWSGGRAQSAVAPRDHAAYVLADGSVEIVTPRSMAGVTRALNKVFMAQHPNVRFTVVEGDNYSSMAALTFDKSAVGPLGGMYTRIGLGDNLKIAAEPVPVRIAHATMTPGPGVPALGVIVNAANPIGSLSLTQVMRLFTVGGPAGDLATWGQAGVKGALAERGVVPYGPYESDYRASDDPQAGEFLSLEKLNGLNMNHSYTGLAHSADVVARVREDAAAVGIVALNQPLDGVKVVALKRTDTGTAVAPTAAEMADGRYPLDRSVYLYLRMGKGMAADAFAQEYARIALTDEGQRAIAADAAGYLALSAGERAEEAGKLGR